MNALDSTDVQIGRLAAERPEFVPVFDRLGLDYCCHGSRTLAEACEHAGVDLSTALRALGDAGAGPHAHGGERDWLSATMQDLADHIEQTHHRLAREWFERLRGLMPRLLSAHGERHPELREVSEVIDQLREEMTDHMIREERVLFPWLRRLERPTAVNVGPPWSVRRPIDCMEHDHVSVSQGLAKLRRLTSDYRSPEDACRTYESVLSVLRDLDRDTRIHIHKENNILFPAGIRAEHARERGGLRSLPDVHRAGD